MTNKKKPPMGHDPLAWMSEVEATPANSPTAMENTEEIKQDTVKSASTEENQLINNNGIVQQSTLASGDPNVPKTVVTSNGWITVILDSTLTLSNLLQLHKELCQYEGKRIELAGDQVTHVDTAALQLLFAFISSNDITVNWKSQPSNEIINAAHLLGLSQQLGLRTPE